MHAGWLAHEDGGVSNDTDMTKKIDRKASGTNKSAKTKDVEVANWQVTKREVVRVVIRRFKGNELIDVRRWYRDAQGELCPGKGISVWPDDLKRLRKALREADHRTRGNR